MSVLRVTVLAMLAATAAFAQTGTVTLNRVEIDFNGRTHSFTPGAANIIDLESIPDVYYSAPYRVFASYTTDHGGGFRNISCQPTHNSPILIPASAFPVLDTLQPGANPTATTSGNVTLNSGTSQLTVLHLLMPPRTNPSLEVVTTFTCVLYRVGAPGPTTYATSGSIAVRHRVVGIRRSLTISATNPPAATSLTPGGLQRFEVTANWEENNVQQGWRLELAAIDSAGNVIRTVRAFRGNVTRPANVGTGSGLMPASSGITPIVMDNVRLPSQPGKLILRLVSIEDVNMGDGPVLRTLATAPDIVYELGTPLLTLTNLLPAAGQLLVAGRSEPVYASAQINRPVAAGARIGLAFKYPGSSITRNQTAINGTEIGIFGSDVPPPGVDSVQLAAFVVDQDGKLIEEVVAPTIYRVLPYEMSHIEVAQVIQDSNNSVPLVAGKAALARVLIRCYTSATVALPNVKLTLTRAGATLAEMFKIGSCVIDSTSGLGAAHLKVLALSETVNFLLPGELLSGKLDITASVSHSIAGGPPVENQVKRATEFFRTSSLNIRVATLCELGCSLFGPRVAGYLGGLFPNADNEIRVEPAEPAVLQLRPTPEDVGLPPEAALLTYSAFLDLAFGVTDLFTIATDTYATADRLPALFGSEPKIRFYVEGIHARTPHIPWSAAVATGLGLQSVFDSCFTAADLGFTRESRGYSFNSPFGGPAIQLVNLRSEVGLTSRCDQSGIVKTFISRGQYEALFNRQVLSSSSASETARNASKTATPQEALLVTGTIRSSGTATLLRAYKLTTTLSDRGLATGGEYCVTLAGVANSAPRCFNATFNANGELPFGILLPFEPAATGVVLRRGNAELARIAASATAPSVQITAPAAGTTLNASTPIVVNWTASDPDGDALRFTVLYSGDGGTSWAPVALDTTARTATVDGTQLRGGSNARFRVVATDGFRTTQATTGALTLAQTPVLAADAIVDAGRAIVGRTWAGRARLRNTGNGPLRITAVQSSSAAIQPAGAFPVVISAGGEREMDLTLAPTAAGPFEATLTLTTNTGGAPPTVRVRGQGLNPSNPILAVGALAPDVERGIVFGSVAVGDPSSFDLFVSNTGGAALNLTMTVSTAAFSLPDTPIVPVRAAAQSQVTLRPNEQATVPIAFKPSAAGVFNGTLTITSNDPSLARLEIPLSGTATPATGAPLLSAAGVVNAASFEPALAPGGIGSIFGLRLANGVEASGGAPLPRTLGGTRVTVGGVEAPLFIVTPGQINFQTPFEAKPGVSDIVVYRDGLVSNRVGARIAADAPGVFMNASTREPIVTRADGSVISAANPARPGDFLVIYATGFGDLTNPPRSGAASAANPLATARVLPTVTLGGTPVRVLFAGLTPFFVGLVQINVQLPATLPPGAALDLVVRSGEAESQATPMPVAQ